MSSSVAGVGVDVALSLLRNSLLRGVRLLELEGDLDLELVLRRDLRDLGGGDALTEGDVDLLRLLGLGERE